MVVILAIERGAFFRAIAAVGVPTPEAGRGKIFSGRIHAQRSPSGDTTDGSEQTSVVLAAEIRRTRTRTRTPGPDGDPVTIPETSSPGDMS